MEVDKCGWCDAEMSNEYHDTPEACIDNLQDALEGMVYQYAHRGDGPTLYTGGMGALEVAFDALGWSDPHPIPEMACDEPGCIKAFSCGWPTQDGGYRQTCYDHAEKD